MNTVRSDIATRKAKNFLRDCRDKFESMAMPSQVNMINTISGNKRRDKAAMQRLTNKLPSVIALEKCSTKGKYKNMWFPVYGRVDYDLMRTNTATQFKHGDTALSLMATLPTGDTLMCVFSYHAIKRMFERYDCLLNEHDNDRILQQLFVIFRTLNRDRAVKKGGVDTGPYEIDGRKFVWSTVGSEFSDEGYLIKTFLPKD